MKNTYIAGGIAVLLLMSVITGGSFIRGQVAGQATTTPITIGATICLTGACVDWGENSRNGLMLAAEEINNAGGIQGRKIVLDIQDSAEDKPSNAVNAYQSLRAKGIDIIIGPTWSNAALALAPVASKDSVLLLSPSVGSPFNEQGENIFKVWPHDDLATRALAEQAYASGVRTVAIIGGNDSWYKLQGDAFAEAFIQKGGVVVQQINLIPGARDVRSEATKIFQSKPDAIFLSNYESVGLMSKELRTLGYTGKQYTVVVDAVNIAQAQGAFEGAYSMQYAKPAPEFTKKYMEKYQIEPGISADTAYDTLFLLKQSIERAQSSDVQAVGAELRGLKTFTGVSGDMTFDGKGSVTKPPVMYQVKNGVLVEVK